MTRRRKIAPIPLEIVTDCPGVALLPAAAFGSLMRLVWSYWQSECRPLPVNGDRIYVLAGAHKATWSIHKTEIMRIFSEAAPALEHAFRDRQKKLVTLAEMRERGVAARHRRRLEKIMTAGDAPAPAAPNKRVAREDNKAPLPAKGFTERRVGGG